MEDIRLIVTDLDGTYVNAGVVPGRNRQAVELARARGVSVMVCTGRCWAMGDTLIPTLGFDQWAVTSNGASIVLAQSGEVVQSTRLKPAWLPVLFEAALSSGCPFDVFCGPYIHTYSPRRSRWTRRCEARALENPGEQVIKFRHFADGPSWLKATKGKAELFRIEVEPGEPFPNELAQVAGALGLGEATMSFRDHYDLCHPDATKANAAAYICQKLGITPDQVMALGDGGNDVDMLRFAGLGVAMAHASDAAKQAADVIAPACEDDGFAWAVHRFVLDGIKGE